MVWETLAAAAVSAAASAYQAHSANQNNMAINTHSAQQAWDMFWANKDINEANMNKTMDYNANEAALARQFSDDQSQRSRSFAQEMSSTEYQRAVADMRQAGLNPMLAYQQGGSSVTSANQAAAGGAASVSPPAAPQPNVPGRIPAQAANYSSAIQAAQVGISMQRQEAEIAEIKARTAQFEAQVPQSVATTKKFEQETDNLREELRLTTARVDGQRLTNATEYARAWLVKAQEDLTVTEEKLARGEIDFRQAMTAKTRVEERLRQLQVPGAEREADIDKSAYGAARPIINKDLGNLSDAVSPWKSRGGPKSYNRTYYDRDGNISGGMSHNYP